MADALLTEKLAFLQAEHQGDSAVSLAWANQEGIEVRHREALVVGFAAPSLAFSLASGIGSRHTMQLSRHMKGQWQRIHEVEV